MARQECKGSLELQMAREEELLVQRHVRGGRRALELSDPVFAWVAVHARLGGHKESLSGGRRGVSSRPSKTCAWPVHRDDDPCPRAARNLRRLLRYPSPRGCLERAEEADRFGGRFQ